MKQVLAMLAFFVPAAVSAAEPEAKVFKDAAGKTLPYRLLKPADPEPGKKYPLVLVLHGAGERGSDNAKNLVWFWDKGKGPLGRPEVAAEKAFALLPQCPDGQQWVNVPWGKGSYQSPEVSEPLRLALQLVDASIKDLPIDPDRVYVIGLSMGGFGTFDALQRRLDLFAAAIPICGAGDLSKAKAIAHIPIWAFHGDQDTAVPVAGSREMVEAMKVAGGKVKYTEFKGVGHNSWSPAFKEKEFWTWLFAQNKK